MSYQIVKALGYFVGFVVYPAALLYLLLSALGVSFGLRIDGNVFVEQGFGFQRTTHLVLLVVLLGFGFYFFRRRSHLNRSSDVEKANGPSSLPRIDH